MPGPSLTHTAAADQRPSTSGISPETGHGVWCQRQQPVDGVLDFGVSEHLHQLDCFFHLLVEVIGSEGHLSWRQRGLFVGGDLVGVVQYGPVPVGADLHRTRRLPLVTEGVHVAHDRVADLVVGFGEDIHWADISHLVHGGHQRNIGVGHVSDAVGPDTASDDHVFSLDGSLVGDYCFDFATAVGAGACRQ